MADETPERKKKRAKKTIGPEVTAAPPARFEVVDRIGWIRLDDPDAPVNTLSSRFLRWIREALPEIEQADLDGLVVVSDKKDSFVVGADLEELRRMEDREEVLALVRGGHDVCDRLSHLTVPVVAAIDGACLGGGLELALACDRRVATDHAKTRLGLPEVQLGVIPGMGGTQRLPRLIGAAAGLDLILTGRRVDARKAKRLGIVEETCHPNDLEKVALDLIGRGKAESQTSALPRQSWLQSLGRKAGDFMATAKVGKRLFFERAREQVLEKTGGHYPAPLRAIDVVHEGLRLPLGEALEVEARTFAELAVSDIARHLIGIFFMKRDVEGRADRLAGKAAGDGDRIGVLGAGFMGAGIAQVLAFKGYQVALKDRDQEALARGMGFCRDRFQDLVKRRRYREIDLKQAMARLHPTLDWEAFRGTDLVIEAVFEDRDLKRRLLGELEAIASDGFVFASNTSTIPIGEIASAAEHSENVVGMHFFSPVHKMPLLEVIRHEGTSEATLARVVSVGRRMGKTVIVVNDGPGFFTSRVLGPFVNEAAYCLYEGATIEQIDRVMTGWGWPVGPLTLLDEVGLDIASHAGGVLREHFGERMDPPPVFQRMLDDGRLGRKAGRGFYAYDGGKKKPDESVYELLGWQPGTLADDEIVDRCWLQMLSEVARCVEDGIIENPVDIDLGVIFGFGFPPFRGGILREADRLGVARVVDRLDALAARYGERLAPPELLRSMAKRGETFHGK